MIRRYRISEKIEQAVKKAEAVKENKQAEPVKETKKRGRKKEVK